MKFCSVDKQFEPAPEAEGRPAWAESRELPTPDRVPGLESIARIYAARLGTRPATGKCFRVGICDDSGEVVSAVLCNDYQDVFTLTRHVETHGYVVERRSDTARMSGCDVLLVKGVTEH